jgi:hypothetical protein
MKGRLFERLERFSHSKWDDIVRVDSYDISQYGKTEIVYLNGIGAKKIPP